MDDVFPRVVFSVLGIGIQDTVVTTWAMIALVMIGIAALNRWRPAALDMLIEFLVDSASMAMGRPAHEYVPLLGTLAVFIAMANSIGVVPGLLAPTRGINTPIALALVVFVSVHYCGVRSRGLGHYLRDLASPLFLLPLEVIGQISRTLALALRLFGNVLSSEMVVAVVFSLLPLIVPLPLMAFGILTGLLQAYIFAVLAAVYVGAALGANEPNPGKKRS
jgi:F-type H+-transporting ATPase subunit a